VRVSVVQAVLHSKSYQLNYPIRQGLIDNWNNMEKLWQRCYYDYLRVEPEEHYVLLVRACRVSSVPAAADFHRRRTRRCRCNCSGSCVLASAV
jgi:actin-related protein